MMESDKVFNFNKGPSTYSLFPRSKSTGFFFFFVGGGGGAQGRLHVIGEYVGQNQTDAFS